MLRVLGVIRHCLDPAELGARVTLAVLQRPAGVHPGVLRVSRGAGDLTQGVAHGKAGLQPHEGRDLTRVFTVTCGERTAGG